VQPPQDIRPAAYPGAPSPYGGYPSPYPPAPPPYPYGQYPYGGGYPPPPRRRVGLPRATAVAPVVGTPFGVALVEVRPTTSGPAVASLVAGIGSVLVGFVVILFAATGAEQGWGPAVAGAFAALATMVGVAAIGLAVAGLRRIRASAAWGPIRGRGVAIAGLVCAAVGIVITALTMLAALLS
jgi:hypothetical protein